MIGSHVKWKGQWNGLLGKWTDTRDYPVGPFVLPGLQAYYDSSDTSSLVYDSAGRVSLFMDKSGNSAVNVLAINATASAQTVYTSPGVTVGTGQLTVSMRVWFPAVNPASSSVLPFSFGPNTTGTQGNNSLYITLETSGTVRVVKRSAADVLQSVLTIANFVTTYGGVDRVITLRRNGTNWQLFVDGIAVGTSSTSFFAETVDSTYLSLSPRNSVTFDGVARWVRFYNTGLSDADVLADAQGAVQSGITVNCDFSLVTKLSTSFVCVTGQTVTVTAAGATGARISGERDLYQGTVANQPIYLPWSGENYGWLNGVSGNYFSTPDSAAVAATTQLDVIAYVAADDWTPTANVVIIGKQSSASTLSYTFQLNTTGGLTLVLSADGTTPSLAVESTAIPVLDRAVKWVRATWRSSDGRVQFFYGDNGVSWTQLGTDKTAMTSSIFNSASAIEVGSRNIGTVANFAGRILYASISKTIGGAADASFDASRYVSGPTFVASTGETWTVQGGAHIVVRTGLYGDGSNDYLKSAAFVLAQPETVCLVASQVSWTSGDCVLDGNAANGGALIQTTSTPQVNLNAGSSVAGNTDWLAKTVAAVFALFNGASSTLGINRVARTTGNAGAGVMNGFTLFANGSGSSNGNIFVSEVAVYSTALSPASQDAIALYEGRKWRFTV